MLDGRPVGFLGAWLARGMLLGVDTKIDHFDAPSMMEKAIPLDERESYRAMVSEIDGGLDLLKCERANCNGTVDEPAYDQ